MTGPLGAPEALVLDRDPIMADLPYWSDVRKRFFRNKLAVAGLVVFFTLVFFAIFGPLICEQTSAQKPRAHWFSCSGDA